MLPLQIFFIFYLVSVSVLDPTKIETCGTKIYFPLPKLSYSLKSSQIPWLGPFSCQHKNVILPCKTHSKSRKQLTNQLVKTSASQRRGVKSFQCTKATTYCNCIVTRGGVYDEILPEPEGNPKGGA